MTTLQIVLLALLVWFIGLFPAAFVIAYSNKNWKYIYLSSLEDDDYVEPIMAFYVIIWPISFIVGIFLLLLESITILIEMFQIKIDKKRKQLS